VKINLILAALILMVSGQVGAAIISGTYFTEDNKKVDLQGLEWLSLDHTAGLSRTYIESDEGWTDQFGNSYSANEWRYATRVETETLLNSLWDQKYSGFSLSNYDGSSWFRENFEFIFHDTGYGEDRIDGSQFYEPEKLTEDAAGFYFGDLFECSVSETYSCYGLVVEYTSESGYTFNTVDVHDRVRVELTVEAGGTFGAFYESYGIDSSMYNDEYNGNSRQGHTNGRQNVGSLLVRDIPKPPSPVPAPAAIWLFGTGILGLIGIKWRRKAA